MHFGKTLLLLASVAVVEISGATAQCKMFKEIYSDGKALCENIFGTAFRYEPNESKGFTMWFFDATNPNLATYDTLKTDSTSPASKWNPRTKCFLDSKQKNDAPSANPKNFTECHPWDSQSCCHYETIQSVAVLKAGYGPEYAWDRCGPLSQACERYFVQEACFYECDPTPGIYRKYPMDTYNADDPNQNAWQIEGMPIKASYCNAWWRACQNDYFCGDGDFFSCSSKDITPIGSTGTTATTGSTNNAGGSTSASVVINMFNSGSSNGVCTAK